MSMSLSTLMKVKLDPLTLLSSCKVSLILIVCLIDVCFCVSASEASFDSMRRGATDDGASVFQGESFSFFEQLASSLHSHHVVSVGDVSFPSSSSSNNKKKKQVSLVVRVKNTSGGIRTSFPERAIAGKTHPINPIS